MAVQNDDRFRPVYLTLVPLFCNEMAILFRYSLTDATHTEIKYKVCDMLPITRCLGTKFRNIYFMGASFLEVCDFDIC